LDKNVTVKVEKPVVIDATEDWFDLIDVKFIDEELVKLMKDIKTGDIVGIKGRVNKECVIGERLQVF
jgi:hypothetical protein